MLPSLKLKICRQAHRDQKLLSQGHHLDIETPRASEASLEAPLRLLHGHEHQQLGPVPLESDSPVGSGFLWPEVLEVLHAKRHIKEPASQRASLAMVRNLEMNSRGRDDMP